MFDELVPVKSSTIAWLLWGSAGVLMLVATGAAWIEPGPAPWSGPVVGWALYLVAGAAVWTVRVTVRGGNRQVMTKLDQVTAQGGEDRLRSLR